MKVCIVTDYFPPDKWGGAESIAHAHARGLRARGIEVCVITTTQDKSKAAWHEYNGIKIYRIYSRYHERWRAWVSLYNPRALLIFKKILKEAGPDIIHVHNIHTHLSYHALKIAYKTGAKIFLTAHDVSSFHYGKLCVSSYTQPDNLEIRNTFDYRVRSIDQLRIAKKRYNPFKNSIARYYLNNFTHQIIAVSHALKDALVQNGIKNIDVVRNGIDVFLWQCNNADQDSYKRIFGCSNRPVILMVGRLTGAKGRDAVLKAMRLVVKEIPRALLLIIGQQMDERTDILGETVKRFNLHNHVAFHPPMPLHEMYKAYCACDVYVTPSVCFDSFPTTNLEAMACGKPVIATHLGGSREVVQDGITGFIVNPLNAIFFAKKITYLLNHTSQAQEMGKQGFKRVQHEFSLGEHINTLLTYYHS